MSDDQRALVAHLMRRAGAGATPAELDQLAARPYAEIVEELINPSPDDGDDDLVFRYFPALANSDTPWLWSGRWIYWMANSESPLREKMALFWHHVFATAWFKAEHGPSMPVHIEMFREHGLDNMRVLLAELSRDPADDLLARQRRERSSERRTRTTGASCWSSSRWASATTARTTSRRPPTASPAGRSSSRFRSTRTADTRPASSSARTCTTTPRRQFLGHTGDFDGEDIIDIIVRQPATGRFIGRHLYNFFVKPTSRASRPGR